jgi:hypothetical protein
MDHDVVVRQKMTERYLLGELDSDARNEFEEHFFDCQECALDVRAGSLFVEQSKVVLAEKSDPVPPEKLVKVPPKPPWLAWLRPVFAAPAMALLLAVIGYQNLVTYPRMSRALNSPQAVPFALLHLNTWGSGGQVIQIRAGKDFALWVAIPPDNIYSNYTAELYNPARKRKWSLPIPLSSVQDQWATVHVPGGNYEDGTYVLVVRGLTAAGESKEVGRASIELQIQK